MPTYPVLGVEDFGRQLIVSGDLDPVYIALSRVEWPEEQKKRWLVAYWLFYHPGAACFISEPQPHSISQAADFWNWIGLAARNTEPAPVSQIGFPQRIERWPRASERRHFRGDKAVEAWENLRRRFPMGYDLVDFVIGSEPRAAYPDIYNRVTSLPQFGPWMAFKVADMLERCLGVAVDFDIDAVMMFDDPKKAALMVAARHMGLAPGVRIKDEPAAIRSVVYHLMRTYNDERLMAPPAHDRPIGLQEVETVLCKWKSHVNGHYPVGKDCKEIAEGLRDWARVSEAAREFLHWMPVGEARTGAIPAE
jgi:hypothetical protein